MKSKKTESFCVSVSFFIALFLWFILIVANFVNSSHTKRPKRTIEIQMKYLKKKPEAVRNLKLQILKLYTLFCVPKNLFNTIYTQFGLTAIARLAIHKFRQISNVSSLAQIKT